LRLFILIIAAFLIKLTWYVVSHVRQLRVENSFKEDDFFDFFISEQELISSQTKKAANRRLLFPFLH